MPPGAKALRDLPYVEHGHERQRLDQSLPAGDDVRPLAVFIHGGGFSGGDKTRFAPRDLQELLTSGVAVAALNYRFYQDAPLPAAFEDCARAGRFPRVPAAEWKLDPVRFGVFGGSAGARISKGRALHEDLAWAGGPDSMARQSTRFACVATTGGQITLDLDRWLKHVPECDVTRTDPTLQSGVTTMDEVQRGIDAIAALNLLSRDDPPVFMSYGVAPGRPYPPDWPTATNGKFHHVVYGVEPGRIAEPLGVDFHLGYPGAKARSQNTVEFLEAKLLAGTSGKNGTREDGILGANPWRAEAIHAVGKNLGEGIEINGPGNVVCHNRVVGFRDCISSLEGPKAYDQSCVDIYNNDVEGGCDDGIEADYFAANSRIMRNRITNCMRGLALAPSLGGPVYVVRNVIANVEGGWEFSRAGSGYVALHNTVVKAGHAFRFEAASRVYARNNLSLGGGAPDQPAVTTQYPPTEGLDFDYDGYGTDGAAFTGRFAGADFDSRETLHTRTTEKHAVRIGPDVFAGHVSVRQNLFPAIAPPDFALRPGSVAVDAGEPVPNVNDGFAGRAPDLGALELDAPAPVYGPRPPGVD